jgi:hypothetical protein
VGFGYQKSQDVIRGLVLSGPAPNFQWGSNGWKLSISAMANDIINHAYVIKLPLKPRMIAFRLLVDSWVHRRTWAGDDAHRESMGVQNALPHAFLCVFFHLASWSVS